MDRRCVICGNPAVDFLPYRGVNQDKPIEKLLFDGGDIAQCRSCSHAFCRRTIDPELLGKYYESEFASERRGNGFRSMRSNMKSWIRALKAKYIGSDWTAATMTQVACTNELFRRSEEEPRNSSISILEVGAGDAEFSRCLQEKYRNRFEQINLNVVEPSSAFDILYRVIGISKIARTIEELSLSEETYDIICFSHCLEHVIDPAAVIAGCRRHLKTTGVVMVEVPNCDGTYWEYRFFPDPPHLQFFNYISLRQLFELGGFKVELLRSYGYKNEVERQIGYLEKDTPSAVDTSEIHRLEEGRRSKTRSFIAMHGDHSPYEEDFIDYLKAPTSSGRNYLFIGATKAP